jgi:hypothetical protein
VKDIDRFYLEDGETNVAVVISTVGPANVAVESRNRETGDKETLVFTPDSAQRVGRALLSAHAELTAAADEADAQ